MKTIFKIFALFLCLILLSCSKGEISKENYEKIEIGMSKAKVEKILGKGESYSSVNDIIFKSSENKNEVLMWKKGDSWIYIVFSNDTVSLKDQNGL